MRALGREWREIHLNPNLQKYVDEPPPSGFGVLYAAVKTIGSEKAYVGKHKGMGGAIVRWRCHVRGFSETQMAAGKKQTIIHNAIVKYGKKNFVFVIIRLVAIADLNAAEVAAIKEYKTDATSKSGYNDSKGGDGGTISERAMESLKKTVSTPEWKTKKRKTMEGLWSDPVYREKAIAGNKAARAKPAMKVKMSKTSKETWSSKSAEERQEWQENIAAAHARNRARRMEDAIANALPYEPTKKKRVKSVCYHRLDGTIGKWDGFKLGKV